MPTKSVVQHDCERCGRTWYEDNERQVASLHLKMEYSDGSESFGDFDVLCPGCEKTARAKVVELLRSMRKNSPTKSEAKKEGGDTLSTAPPSSIPAAVATQTPSTATTQPSPSYPSRRS